MGGIRPGPTNHNPFSALNPSRTPGTLGCRDAADPNSATLRGDTPGCLGINDDAAFNIERKIDPIDYDFLVRHKVLKSKLIESSRLSGLQLNHKLWKGKSIWKVGDAIVFRVGNIVEDLDGSARAYHPPTDASWNGYGHGLGKDSLANAVSVPGVTAYAKSKKESDWALTAGCQLFRDLHRAKQLEPKAATVGKPPAAGLTQAAAEKAAKEAQDAKTELDALLKKYSATKIADLETQSKSAVCVLYVDGRPKQDSRADWGHVSKWAGVQTDGSGKPIVRASGPNKGFYLPRITPAWADAEEHPWVVLNPPQGSFGVNLTNSAVVIQNGDPPTIAFGMVADGGPEGHLGEVSRKMISELGITGDPPKGDYIIVQFPQNVSSADIAKPKALAAIQSDAKATFDAWTFEGRSGRQLIQELFPSPEQYQRAKSDFADSKKHLSTYIDQLNLKLH